MAWPTVGGSSGTWGTELINQLAVAHNTDGTLKVAWGSWTPTVTQSASVTFTATYAKYIKIGDLVIVSCLLSITSAGTANNVIVVGGIPYSITGDLVVGSGKIVNSGTANYVGCARAYTGTSVSFEADALGNSIGVTPNFALASGDSISFTIVYEDVT
jgi:hypothetical protein